MCWHCCAAVWSRVAHTPNWGQSDWPHLNHQTKAIKKKKRILIGIVCSLNLTVLPTSRPEGLARLTESVSGIKFSPDTGTKQVNFFCSQQDTPQAAGFSWSQALVVSVWVIQAASTNCPGWDGIKLGTTGMSQMPFPPAWGWVSPPWCSVSRVHFWSDLKIPTLSEPDTFKSGNAWFSTVLFGPFVHLFLKCCCKM